MHFPSSRKLSSLQGTVKVVELHGVLHSDKLLSQCVDILDLFHSHLSLILQHEPFRWILGAATTPAIEANFPDFNRAEILTTERMERIGLIEESYGALATALTLLTGVQLTKPGWTENPSVKKFMAMTSNGSKPILGPLLVIHGEADMRLDVEVATAAVEKTAKEFPGAAIKFLRVEGVDHDPAIASTQWV